jgi:hypothetical protein
VELLSRTKGHIEEWKLRSKRYAEESWLADADGDGDTDVVFLNNVSTKADRVQLWLLDGNRLEQADYVGD